MGKFLSSFVLLVVSANAALISIAEVNCNGNVTTASSGSIACQDGILWTPPDWSSASAYVQRSSASTLIALDARAFGAGSHFGSAHVTLQDDFVITVTSGPEQGFLLPCLYAGLDFYPYGSASAAASFGTRWSVSAGRRHPDTTCGFPPNASAGAAFTLGVPQTFTLSLSVSAYGGPAPPFQYVGSGAADASLGGFDFFDSSRNPVSVTYSLDPAPAAQVPEPAAVTFTFWGLLALRYMRREHRWRTPSVYRGAAR